MSGKHLIIEVEQIHGDYIITVSNDGTITFAPLPDKEARPLGEQSMPPQKLWDGISAMLKGMKEHNEDLLGRLADVGVKLEESRQEVRCALEERRKFVSVGSNKKNMFVAGITLGRLQERKCTR